jgi:hypothetical protein
MSRNERYIEIYNNNQEEGKEKYIDIVTLNGRIFKRFFSSSKFNNSKEVYNFIDILVIERNCQMIKQDKECTIFGDLLNDDTRYYVYLDKLFVEKIILQKIEHIKENEIKEKFYIF